MRICLISVEIFSWGKYGGFGRATRIIGPRAGQARCVGDRRGARRKRAGTD